MLWHYNKLYLFVDLRLWLGLIHHSYWPHIIKLWHRALHNIWCLALCCSLLFLVPFSSSLSGARTSSCWSARL